METRSLWQIVSPTTHEPLYYSDNHCAWVSSDGSVVAPQRGHVHWLLAQPELHRRSWLLRCQGLLSHLERRVAVLGEELKVAKGLVEQHRLSSVRRALIQQLEHLKLVLSPLESNHPADGRAEAPRPEGVLTGFAPTLNGLLNHYDHLCRDWSFGRLEIHQQMQLLEPLIPAGPAMPAVVLGCGGARLPFELQQSKRVGPLLCIDINPVLLESARLITGGSKLTLPEFPLAPILDSEPALIRTCARPPEAAEPEIVWALGDVHALPLASGSVEFLLTPFLIDILDQPVSHLIRELARVLKPGGVWLNIGTLFFQRLAERERLSMSELMDLASENGLEIEEQSTSVIGYLNSPASGHRRSEQTWAWRARRKDNASSPDLRAKSSASRTPRIVISSPGDLERAELILTAKAQLVGWLKERWPVTSSGPLSLDLAEVSRAAAQAWSLEIEQATALVSEILRQELPGAVTSEPV